LFHKNYHRVYNYALREIRFRCYQGFSKPGDITVRDILDDALVQVSERMLSRFDERRALRLIYDEIRRTIDGQLRPPGTGMVPIEQIIGPEDIDREYEEYYQPDELIKVEDIVIDENAELPERKIEYEEIEIYIDRILSQLPADWREAFILIEREGISAEELAKNRNKSVESVLHDLEMTKIFLREKLGDAGFDWKKNAAFPASSPK
jgi:RNA polymerase sigma factor (sigma-70 family)